MKYIQKNSFIIEFTHLKGDAIARHLSYKCSQTYADVISIIENTGNWRKRSFVFIGI